MVWKGLSENVSHYDWPKTENFKIARPEAFPKSGIWTEKSIIQNLFGFYLLISDFLAERLKANKS